MDTATLLASTGAGAVTMAGGTAIAGGTTIAGSTILGCGAEVVANLGTVRILWPATAATLCIAATWLRAFVAIVAIVAAARARCRGHTAASRRYGAPWAEYHR